MRLLLTLLLSLVVSLGELIAPPSTYHTQVPQIVGMIIVYAPPQEVYNQFLVVTNTFTSKLTNYEVLEIVANANQEVICNYCEVMKLARKDTTPSLEELFNQTPGEKY